MGFEPGSWVSIPRVLGFEPDSWVSIPMGFEPYSWVARGFDPGYPVIQITALRVSKVVVPTGLGFDPAESLGCRTQRMLCFDPW